MDDLGAPATSGATPLEAIEELPTPPPVPLRLPAACAAPILIGGRVASPASVPLSTEDVTAIIEHGEAPVRGRMQELADLRRRMFQLFEEPLGLPIFRGPVGWMPDVDITETNGDILVKAELPGMTKEDVDIEIEGNVLTLKGEKKEEKEETEKEHYLYERRYGAFERSFTLPTAVKEDRVKAELEEGVPRITLPRSGEPRGKKIQIAGGFPGGAASCGGVRRGRFDRPRR